MKKGKLVIIEGSDGSGKSTQLNLLLKYLKKNKVKHSTLDFPQYNKFWGRLIGRFLTGEFGELHDINPYLIQPIYMLDQASKAESIQKDLDSGKIVLSNRYITSSMAHQTSRLPRKQQEHFLNWVQKAGYDNLGVVREDLVIILFFPPKMTYSFLKNKDAQERKKYSKKGREIAEENFEHQKESARMYKKLCEKYDHWKLVNCTDSKGNVKPIEMISQEIVSLLKSEKII